MQIQTAINRDRYSLIIGSIKINRGSIINKLDQSDLVFVIDPD